VQQKLDALLHSGLTEACLITALADQPAECYHNQVVTVPVQPSGITVLSYRQIVECSSHGASLRNSTCFAFRGQRRHRAKIPDCADRWHRVIANYQRDCWQLLLATARRAPEYLRLRDVQPQAVRGHPVADSTQRCTTYTALKFVCSSWLTEPLYLGIHHLPFLMHIVSLRVRQSY